MMDSVINAAIEEICIQVREGLNLSVLWSKLQPSLSSLNLSLTRGCKQSIWANLLCIPNLRFEVQNEPYSTDHPSIQNFEDAEKLSLKIVAQQSLIDSFFGLYNTPSANANMRGNQRRVLELLAMARENGITQSQLGKQLGIEARNFHYVLRGLESQGLIVKHDCIEKTERIGTDGESKYYPSVTTHLVYLNRYAKQLGSHQRFEITKKEQDFDSPEDANGSASKEETDVLVKDFAHQMKAICDKLAKAKDQVLFVSDIKKDFGYCGSLSRRRAWNPIFRRLQADNIVEAFPAKVDDKDKVCLRLLKLMTTTSEKEDQNLKSGKICQAINQLVELPVEHQIFDMIDAAGAGGITLKEISQRFGIDPKGLHNRFSKMHERFGIRADEERLEKPKMIRVSAFKNSNPEPGIALIHKLDENKILDQHLPDSSPKMLSEYDALTSNGDRPNSGEMEDAETGAELSCVSPVVTESNYVGTSTSLQELIPDQGGTVSSSKHDLISTAAEEDVPPLGGPPPDGLDPLCAGSYQNLNLSSTLEATRRAKRILARLEDEKIILRSEMPKWLDSFEDKHSAMDRKTVDRILNKLQEQGLCKCITVNVPVKTDCSRSRLASVVLHPSLKNLSSELVDEIQERVRSFDQKIRREGFSRKKDDGPIPVVDVIQKTRSHREPDGRVADKAGAMRANGFILAKMIRAKLLHSFLWDYLHGSTSDNDDSLSEECVYELNNPHSSSRLFSLDAAIKAIPVELFLQVVGSPQKYEEMIKKCKMRLRLSDLMPQECKSLMDSQATARLSLVIDILRRLKLIRMVANLQSRDEVKVGHASLSHMMELKPYIEEPFPNDAGSLNFKSLDLRPRIRHDFVLSNRDAVDEYWRTLEYCYAAADQRAASYAFPGSVVPEVFRFRSWTSTRLMTAEQREHLHNVLKDNRTEKLSYKECEKIAKDLNLTLEQVLNVYYSRRRNHLNHSKDDGGEIYSLGHKRGSSHVGKYSFLDARLAKHSRIDAQNDIGGMHMEKQDASDTPTGEHATQEYDHCDIENSGTNENEDCYPLISQCVLSKIKPPRQRRFLWSDEADRQLVIQYVRHRAASGAKYHRTDWVSLSNLPAPPQTCRKRMALLNGNLRFRTAVMRLCNMLGERYAKHLEKVQNMSLNKDDCRVLVQSPSRTGTTANNTFSHNIETQGLNEEAWDDFECKTLKTALDEVLCCKRMAKLEALKSNRPLYEEWPDTNMNFEGYDSQEEVTESAVPHEIIQSHHGKSPTFSAQKSRRRRLDKKFTRFLSNRANVDRQVYESLAVSNAVELFKLVFLSTSRGTQAPNLLANILRRYSEHDLFAAFNYLREKKIMIGGNGSQPFELSQQFLHSVSRSPFPSNTGKRAVKFSAWLHERDKDLTERGANLTEDLQCGDIFHLFALVSSGELSLSPCLPDNGVGEAEDLRNTKRKLDGSESSNGDKAKKLKSAFGVEGEIISRREKGFPGIIVSADRATIPRADTVDLFNDDDSCKNEQLFVGSFQLNIDQRCNHAQPKHMLEIFDSYNTVHIEKDISETPWEAMAGYARKLVLLSSNQEEASANYAEVFRLVCTAIQEAGDQGLNIEEVSKITYMPGLAGVEVDGLVVDVLQTFGRAIKVNAYNSVRIVDALYCCKYYLTSVSGFPKGGEPPSAVETMCKGDDAHKIKHTKEYSFSHVNLPKERNMGTDSVHKVTILNLPRGVVDSENHADNKNEGCMQDQVVLSTSDHERETLQFSSSESCVPILPWVNGDGTINTVVYKGLRRRVLGIVMQSPGILEDDIIRQMHVLNPQNCRKLLELMLIDKHLITRKMHQSRPDKAPSLLQNLIGSKSSHSSSICRRHFFANPMSTALL